MFLASRGAETQKSCYDTHMHRPFAHDLTQMDAVLAAALAAAVLRGAQP